MIGFLVFSLLLCAGYETFVYFRLKLCEQKIVKCFSMKLNKYWEFFFVGFKSLLVCSPEYFKKKKKLYDLFYKDARILVHKCTVASSATKVHDMYSWLCYTSNGNVDKNLYQIKSAEYKLNLLIKLSFKIFAMQINSIKHTRLTKIHFVFVFKFW